MNTRDKTRCAGSRPSAKPSRPNCVAAHAPLERDKGATRAAKDVLDDLGQKYAGPR